MGQIRPEWASDPVPDWFASDPVSTLDTFAYGQTAELLAVEPRLAALAHLVRATRPVGGEWRGVEQLVSLLLGPTRSAPPLTHTNKVPGGLHGALFSETIRRRYVDALRTLVAEDAA